MNKEVAAHPGLRDFMARRGLSEDALRSKGRLTLTIDGEYRVHFRPDIDASLVLYARIASFPEGRAHGERDRWLERLMNSAAGMLRDYASTLSIEPQLDDLLLQQSLARGTTGEQLETELGEFVNAMKFWRQIATHSG